jgi:hypothetical protein
VKKLCDQSSSSRKVEVRVTVELKNEGGKVGDSKYILVDGSCPADTVLESVEKAATSRKFVRWVEAVADLPYDWRQQKLDREQAERAKKESKKSNPLSAQPKTEKVKEDKFF